MMAKFLNVLVLAAALGGAAAAQAQATAPDAAAAPPEEVQDRGWPRAFSTNDYDIVIHEPQVDAWPDFARITFRAAIAIAAKGEKERTYGTVRVSAATRVSKADRLVLLTDRKVEQATFPDAPKAVAERLTAAVLAISPPDQAMTISLDRILAQLDTSQVKVRQVEVNLAPPRILASAKPAVVVVFLGKPRFKPVPESDVMFAVNTNWDLFLDPGTSTYFLLNDKAWLSTNDLEKGPWTAATALPAGLSKLPADDNWADVRAALPLVPAQDVPAVFVSREPTELIVTEGEPEFQPIPGTRLMLVANTDSQLLFHPGEKQFYLLAAGRWFKAEALAGPWSAASASLPADFRGIPEDSDAADVLVAVPGTPAAQEAVILASIPEKATINRTEVTITVTYDGEPQLKPVEGTSIQYVFNTPDSVLLVEGKYYCCRDAVWFVSSEAKGPWSVCVAVPDVIYTIPPTSPKHNVTYVTVYESTPTTVVTGYTSGYSGATVAATGAVMFGLGLLVGAALEDDDDHYSYHYQSCHVSYGCGARYHGHHGGYVSAGRVYGPYGGAGRYAAYDPHTGAYSRGAAAYGPRGAAGYHAAYNPSSGKGGYVAGGRNAYGSWGRGAVTNGDDWVRGGYRSGPRGTVGAIEGSEGAGAVHREGRFGNGATVARDQDGDIYAGKDGNVYQKTDDGWEQKTGAGVARPTTASTKAIEAPAARPAATPTAATGQAATTQRGADRPTAAATPTAATRQAGAERPAATPSATTRAAPPQAGNLQREASARARGEQSASRTQQFQRGGGSPSWRSGGSSRGGGRR